MDLQKLYDDFVALIDSMSDEEIQREAERAIAESKDSYLMDNEEETNMMQKVVCINDNTLNGILKGGKVYYLNLSSLYGDYEGDWYVDVYTEEREKYVGRFLLKHFKSLI